MVKDDEDEAGDCDNPNDNKGNGADNEVCKPAVLKNGQNRLREKNHSSVPILN